MQHTFDKVAATARSWSTRPGVPGNCVGIAGTFCHMANRLATRPSPDLTGEKALKVVGCYLCRRVGASVCNIPNSEAAQCPLGFFPNLE